MEEQSVKSPPCLPHPEPTHAGTQSAIGGARGKHTPTEAAQITPLPQILQDFSGFRVGLPFLQLLHSKTIFENEVLREKVIFLFLLIFSALLCSPREQKVVFTGRN